MNIFQNYLKYQLVKSMTYVHPPTLKHCFIVFTSTGHDRVIISPQYYIIIIIIYCSKYQYRTIARV